MIKETISTLKDIADTSAKQSDEKKRTAESVSKQAEEYKVETIKCF